MKKKLEMMPEVRNEFVYGKKSIWDKEHKNVLSISQEDSPYCEGSVKRNFTEQFSNNIFDIMQEFAKYSFNKPHAFCYAVCSYKDAWAWVYFPCEYAIACIKNLNDQEKINAVIRQAKKLGVDLLPPDIRYSYSAPIMDTSKGKKDIRYGLSAIKDVGVECVNYITEVRKHYKLDSFDQFYYTMHDQNVVNTYSNKTTKSGTKTSPVTKKAEVALIKAGAFDFCEPNRYKLLNHYLIDIKKDKTHVPLDEKAYCKKYKLQYEKDTMGGYISENPLDGFPFKDLDDCNNNEVVETTCIVKNVTIKTAKNKKDYATVVCEDKNGKTVKGMFFDKAYTQNAKKLKKKEILILNGVFNERFKNINVDKCTRLIKKGDVIRLPDEEDGIIDMTTQQAPIQIQMPVVNI